MAKKIIALLLVCVFVGAALVGCGSKETGNDEETNGGQSTEGGNA